MELFSIIFHRLFGNVSDTYDTSHVGYFQFFGGMNIEEAKKEYRKLMKKYHPDNENGDTEMAKKISLEYQQYCTIYDK